MDRTTEDAIYDRFRSYQSHLKKKDFFTFEDAKGRQIGMFVVRKVGPLRHYATGEYVNFETDQVERGKRFSLRTLAEMDAKIGRPTFNTPITHYN